MAAAADSSTLISELRPVKQLSTVRMDQSHDGAVADQPERHSYQLAMHKVNGSASIPVAASMPPPASTPPHSKQLTVPPPPRSLYQPWHPYCTLHWYNTQSPSVLSGLSPQAISATHYSTYIFLSVLSLALRYPSTVLECAMSLYHRFYARCSIAQYADVRRVAAVCLFLASKVEDAPRRLIELLRQFEVMQRVDDARQTLEAERHGEAEKPAVDEKEWASEREHALKRILGVTSITETPTLPSPASLSPAVNHVLVEQQERDKLDKLTPSEHGLRTQFTALESEVLLANDFDFTFPLPSRYVRLLVRQLVLAPPRTDTAKEDWEDEVRRIAWDRAMVKGGEDLVASAMRRLSLLLPTSACLHFSPQCIAVYCVLTSCIANDVDIEQMLQLGDWVTVAPAATEESEQQLVDVLVVKGEPADVRFSPSSFTSTTPSFSPLYAVSPSSPITASPASLSSYHSSPSQPPVLQPTSLASTAVSASSSVACPNTAAWVQRVLPNVTVDDVLSLIGVLNALPSLVAPPVRNTDGMQRVLQGLDRPAGTRTGGEMLDILNVRAEYEAVVSEMTEARRQKEVEMAQKGVGEEKRRREEEEKSREKREDDTARRRMRDVVEEPIRPVSQERQQRAPLSPPRARRGGRGGREWYADVPANQRPASIAARESGSWRGTGHRGGWGGQPEPRPQVSGWQSTVVERAPAIPAPLHSQSHLHRRPLSPVRRRSPSPPAKRKRSPSRSPTRHVSNGRDREREVERDRDREREGRAVRENGDRQWKRRSRSPSPDERYRGSSRAKRHAPPMPVRDRDRGRR